MRLTCTLIWTWLFTLEGLLQLASCQPLISNKRDAGRVKDCGCVPPCLPPTVTNTSQRLNALRSLMESLNVSVYVIPATDPHLSEYIAPQDQRRAWITGFTGTAGTAVVSKMKATLWTDGRYWLQAERQMDCNWELNKGETTIVNWILNETKEGDIVAADPFVFSIVEWESYKKPLLQGKRQFVAEEKNLVDIIWGTDRPPNPTDDIFKVPDQFYERTWQMKVIEIRAQMKQNAYRPTALLISALDETAWLFNLRGDDIPYNPFFKSYTLLAENFIRLFVNESRLPQHIRDYLNTSCTTDMCVQLKPYADIRQNLQEYAKGNVKIWIGQEYTTYGVYEVIPESKLLIHRYSPVQLTKAVKDTTEQKGLKAAHVRDAIAVIRYFVWLEKNVPKGTVTELSGADNVNKLRREQKHSKGISFETISASGLNAALAHYSPNNETNRKLSIDEMYLIDSGGQYLDGTTDITRTLHWGTPTDFQKEAYTRVLMGNIDLARSVFPTNTIGDELDVWARHALWEAGLNYMHGTGHGIGTFLSVHEWPVGIGSPHTCQLQEGMFTSIEPGFYQDNEFGIRIEDVSVVVKAKTKHTFGGVPYLTFEHISLVPYERKLINVSIMNKEQIDWLNKYYERIWNTVSPELQAQNLLEEYDWLRKHTQLFSHSVIVKYSLISLAGALLGSFLSQAWIL
ncbi:xaa-Pro aminopeptidase 2 isoform X2 [Stegostoma tigrinum]|uniref:xaa-Pro aminopeptidase 2 isoform X2 n=1 Tax=Stegostoma tigrinum TaxID=3053191 RepID=UPI00202B3C86|nr:xaa-Pro aminopeptidase 2 isoform X2 [Stegostoma tigrinum]XP_048400525.1 xaa-Pro aminopeptidase 2 isoform X2 [Stegostoma tigrinum]